MNDIHNRRNYMLMQLPEEAVFTMMNKLLDHLKEDPEDPSMTILFMRTLGRYTETGQELSPSMKKQVVKHFKPRRDFLYYLLNGTEYEGLQDMMEFFHQPYINWRDTENLDHLLMVNEFYTAMYGIAVAIGEDPTKGSALVFLEEAIEAVRNNKEVFKGAKVPVTKRLLRIISLNPVNQLWAEITGQIQAEA